MNYFIPRTSRVTDMCSDECLFPCEIASGFRLELLSQRFVGRKRRRASAKSIAVRDGRLSTELKKTKKNVFDSNSKKPKSAKAVSTKSSGTDVYRVGLKRLTSAYVVE